MRQGSKTRANLLRIFFAAQTALLFYVLMCMFTYTAYVSGEDSYVMHAIAGSFADRPMVWAPCLNPVLVRALALLCRAFPTTNVYALLQRLLILVSLFICNLCVFSKIGKRRPGREILPGVLICALIDGTMVWTLARMHSLCVAAVTGAAAVALVMTADLGSVRSLPMRLTALAFAFFGVAYAPESPAVPCVLLLCVILRGAAAWKERGKVRPLRALWRYAAFALALCLLVGGCTALYRIELSRKNDGDYASDAAAAAAFAAGETPAAQDAAGAYAAAGWSEELYEMARLGYRMDERINAGTISAALQQTGSGAASSRPGDADAMKPVAGLCALMAGLLLACIALSVGAGAWKRAVPPILVAACGALLCALLRGQGAYRAQSFLLPLLPCAMFLWFEGMDLAFPQAGQLSSGQRAGRARDVGAILGAVAVIGCYGLYALNTLGYLGSEENRAFYESAKVGEQALADYAAGHRSQLLVYDTAALSFREPFVDRTTGDLSNVVAWGGVGYGSYPEREQLRQNGVGHAPLQPEDFARSDVRFITDSQEDIASLLRYLSADYDIHACVITHRLQDGLLVVRFTRSYDTQRIEEADRAAESILTCEGGQIRRIDPARSSGEADPSPAEPSATHTYRVYYHRQAGEAESDIYSTGLSRVPLHLKTNADLGTDSDAMLFAGWRAYRSDTRCWRVQARSGAVYWARSLPEGGSYSLYSDGDELLLMAAEGTEVHLYGQWDPYYTIWYHRTEYSRPHVRSTQVIYGEKTDTLSYQELGFSRSGKRFLGWKVYRADTHSWLYRNSAGETYWYAGEPEGRRFRLYSNEMAVSTTVPAGTTLHFYGQWEDTDAFTVFYHPDEEAPAHSTTTEVTYGQKTKTLTVAKLGFLAEGKRFAGWKAWCPNTRSWRVLNAEGKARWQKDPAEDADYYLYKDGARLAREVNPGYEVHLYAQWEDTDDITVYYHILSSITPQAQPAVRSRDGSVLLTSVDELGFSVSGCVFTGWRVKRANDECWLFVDADEEAVWAEKKPKGSQYMLLADGALLPDIAAGSTIHFYAQWEPEEDED